MRRGVTEGMCTAAETLAAFSDDELIEELARRKNARAVAAPEHWCHDCRNCLTWRGRGEPPNTFNPCSKGHTMQFIVPEEMDDEWGYYRRVCADRDPLEAP